MSFMSYEGLEPVALSMSQGNGPQSFEGSNSSFSQTSPDFGGAYFSLDYDEINIYDNILNLQAPDFTTVMMIVHGEGCWAEVMGRFQDLEFVTLMNVMNSLVPETVEDNTVIDSSTLVNFMNNLGQEIDDEDVPYDVVKVLLNVDDDSEEL